MTTHKKNNLAVRILAIIMVLGLLVGSLGVVSLGISSEDSSSQQTPTTTNSQPEEQPQVDTVPSENSETEINSTFEEVTQ